jgi:hypothetical protein
MNPNHPAKFLIHKNEDILVPVNTQFSGIFNKALIQENINLLNNRNNRNKLLSSPQLSDSTSNSTVETIDYEFLTPSTKTKVVRHHHVASSPSHELNLTEYFLKMDKPRILQNLDNKQMEILKKVSRNVPENGNITFKS